MELFLEEDLNSWNSRIIISNNSRVSLARIRYLKPRKLEFKSHSKEAITNSSQCLFCYSKSVVKGWFCSNWSDKLLRVLWYSDNIFLDCSVERILSYNSNSRSITLLQNDLRSKSEIFLRELQNLMSSNVGFHIMPYVRTNLNKKTITKIVPNPESPNIEAKILKIIKQ